MQPFLDFELPGFAFVAENTMADNERTIIGIHYFAIPPDLTADFSDLRLLQQATALMVAQQDATLIEADVVGIGGLPALRQIVKVPLPDQPTGQASVHPLIARVTSRAGYGVARLVPKKCQ